MENFAHYSIRLVELITSNDMDVLPSADANRQVDIPAHVQDLMYFGRAAGEAAELIADGDAASIKLHCSRLSRLAAIVANDLDVFYLMHSYMTAPITHIVAALGAQGVRANWNDAEREYRDLVGTITWVTLNNVTKKLITQVALAGMVNLTKTHKDLTSESICLIMDRTSEAACTNRDCFAPAYMDMVKASAIKVVENVKVLDDSWRAKATAAISSLDFESEVYLTEDDSQLANEVFTILLENFELRDVAITVGWLGAVYRYTEYRQRIEDFFDLTALEIENEDRQEDAENDTSDGLAA